LIINVILQDLPKVREVFEVRVAVVKEPAMELKIVRELHLEQIRQC
jgi:hypothetical protein